MNEQVKTVENQIPMDDSATLPEDAPETPVREATGEPTVATGIGEDRAVETGQEANPAIDADTDASGVSDALPVAEDTERLRRKLNDLKQQLETQKSAMERMEAECREFKTLFPETPMERLPDSVWDDVKKGIPLAAAYALAERKRAYMERLAGESNQKNRERSSGGLTHEENGYYSPEEVRSMSPDEVHRNYLRIQQSMKHWK